MKLYCATTNAGKLREFHAAGADVEALPSLREIPPSPEDFLTFEENAIQKALYYSAYTDGLLFADDSGLVVDALGGAPGVHSARYAGEPASDQRNNERLLANLRRETNRVARFVCVIALARCGTVVQTFRGEVEGEILAAERGDGGFGYDPLFYYAPLGCTLAEIPHDSKFAISHRGKAFRKLMEYI